MVSLSCQFGQKNSGADKERGKKRCGTGLEYKGKILEKKTGARGTSKEDEGACRGGRNNQGKGRRCP